MKRNNHVCSPEHECSLDEIILIAEESANVDKDINIKKFSNPNVTEMNNIISIAENYTGEWYHSYVSIDFSKIPPEDRALADKIFELGSNAGIYVVESIEMSPELEEALRNPDPALQMSEEQAEKYFKMRGLTKKN